MTDWLLSWPVELVPGGDVIRHVHSSHQARVFVVEVIGRSEAELRGLHIGTPEVQTCGYKIMENIGIVGR